MTAMSDSLRAALSERERLLRDHARVAGGHNNYRYTSEAEAAESLREADEIAAMIAATQQATGREGMDPNYGIETWLGSDYAAPVSLPAREEVARLVDENIDYWYASETAGDEAADAILSLIKGDGR